MVGLSSSLVELKMENVEGLTELHEEDSEACKSLVSLQKLEVWGCKKLVSLAEKEVSSLKQVILFECYTLESYDCPSSVERLEIKCCPSLKSLTLSIMQDHASSISKSIVGDCDNIQPISRLTSLHIEDCKNLKSFLHEHLHSLTALEEMLIHECPSMDYSFPCGLWPPNIRSLEIGCLNKPMSEWGVQNFPSSLVHLELDGYNSGVVSFEVAEDVGNVTTITPSSFILPPSLVSLQLSGFKDVESFSEVLQHLPFLKKLYIFDCPKIRDIEETSDPSSNLTITIN